MINPFAIATEGLLSRSPITMGTGGYIYFVPVVVTEKSRKIEGGGGGGLRGRRVGDDELHKSDRLEQGKIDDKDILSIIQIFVRCQKDPVF